MCKVTNSSSLLGTVLVFTLKMQHPRNSFSLRQTQMVGYPKHIKENSTYDICPAPNREIIQIIRGGFFPSNIWAYQVQVEFRLHLK